MQASEITRNVAAMNLANAVRLGKVANDLVDDKDASLVDVKHATEAAVHFAILFEKLSEAAKNFERSEEAEG